MIQISEQFNKKDKNLTQNIKSLLKLWILNTSNVLVFLLELYKPKFWIIWLHNYHKLINNYILFTKKIDLLVKLCWKFQSFTKNNLWLKTRCTLETDMSKFRNLHKKHLNNLNFHLKITNLVHWPLTGNKIRIFNQEINIKNNNFLLFKMIDSKKVQIGKLKREEAEVDLIKKKKEKLMF